MEQQRASFIHLVVLYARLTRISILKGSSPHGWSMQRGIAGTLKCSPTRKRRRRRTDGCGAAQGDGEGLWEGLRCSSSYTIL
jgi:hypothetical protein